jgi:hypothetical protein
MRLKYRVFSVEAGGTNFYSRYTEVPVLFLCFLLCLAPLCIDFTLFFNCAFFLFYCCCTIARSTNISYFPEKIEASQLSVYYAGNWETLRCSVLYKCLK